MAYKDTVNLIGFDDLDQICDAGDMNEEPSPSVPKPQRFLKLIFWIHLWENLLIMFVFFSILLLPATLKLLLNQRRTTWPDIFFHSMKTSETMHFWCLSILSWRIFVASQKPWNWRPQTMWKCSRSCRTSLSDWGTGSWISSPSMSTNHLSSANWLLTSLITAFWDDSCHRQQSAYFWFIAFTFT